MAGIAAGGGVISLDSVVGFVAVLGIAARNGIMLVSHYRHLQLDEGCEFGAELVLRGAQERLVPILMTAMLALVPIALGGNLPGYEIDYPMALVILGGMFPRPCSACFSCPPSIYGWESPWIVTILPNCEPLQGQAWLGRGSKKLLCNGAFRWRNWSSVWGFWP